MTYDKIIKLLAITGTLLTATAKANEAEKIKPALGIFTVTEQDTSGQTYIGASLSPEISWTTDDLKLAYYGSFYREGKDPGEDSGWSTLVSKVQAENEEWKLEIGRNNTRKYAGHLYTPTTCNFDNKGVGKGTCRKYTGTILSHKESGVSLGLVAPDGNLKANNLDQILLGWATELSDEWALQLQLAADKDGLDKAGATIKWQPTDTTTVVTEAIHKDDKTTTLLTTNHKLTDDLTLFGGAQMTWAKDGEDTGLLTAGARYKIGSNFTAVAATEQKIGSDRETTVLAGIQYSGNCR